MKTILIVDDEHDIAEALGDILEDEGYAVQRAIHGREGLNRIQERPPDLIILDMMMPVMDGREVLAILHKDERLRAIPVIAISAASLRDVAATYGVKCLTKPFDLDKLLHSVAELLSAAS